MNFSSAKRPATQFYQQDIVQKTTTPHSIGIVLRCWHDAEDVPIPNPLQDPLMRSLERGEVGVSFLTETADKREILSESELKLLDRTLQPGDVVKHSVDDVHSGMVLDVRVRARLEHAISKVRVEGWKTSEDLDANKQAEIGDYVVYENWIGQVIELYDENIIEVPSGQLVRLPELGSRLSVGETSENILPSPVGGVQNMLEFLFGTNRTTGLQTVIAINHTVYAIAWLALNQTLDISIFESQQRPQRFWYGPDIAKLTLVRNRLDFQMRIGETVRLKDTTGHPVTMHGREEEAGGVVTVNSFNVSATETEADILWQDGSRETLRSVDIIPYMNPDEYDCWPGDHVFFIGGGGGVESIPGVVQTVDAVQRTATILLHGNIEQVSLLELDSQGASDTSPFSEIEGLGVRRGEIVFIHAPGKNNGFEAPRIPRIGELEPWVRSNPFTYSGQVDGWREELATIGADIATRRISEAINDGTIKSKASPGTLAWLGEVIDLRPDGLLDVLHADGSSGTYALERLTKLSGGIDQLDDELYEDGEGSENEHPIHGIWDYDYHWGSDQLHDSGDEYDEDMTVPDAEQLPELSSTMASASPPDNIPVESYPLDAPKSDQQQEEEEEEEELQTRVVKKQNDSWENFKILSSAPSDHAFHQTTAAQPSRQFMSRLNREYRVLMNSLPENILVRAYEDRADLIRSLIIGPSNTPYQDCPFVIDWHLVDYPHSAPVAHFHSLTNGNGRVNPNLYEEGKVCLSILNTWTAIETNESWDASRSSLLQALVSIQGLVLVREPWFCEPAYEKLRGTEEGTVNSRLYSEKAYVLSRNFVRRTLEAPFGGLDTEINWLYFTNHLLEKVLRDSRALINASRLQSTEEQMEEQMEQYIIRLSTGGMIALERTLTALQNLLDAHSVSV
ncbi:hypothetical protein J3R30DRAFT_3443035 [Lentinula aciculospora]|uniref:UBC core domain-containing protein n=1 Tax=Lentinula aciculospora TaxID=153920 RepID=A0A9W9AMH1_9AGAR|nr:hypothetical protein J3R30DRAFT_3443035 [Lentinula aciculospora]